ncbi:NAD(P)-dependent alcohol dehydrogenase [Nitriliruptor alkaliphilus]|uniref:NAD(P)-dependent alcohol dehydrogenase n=1 Tax=Nitriliruptor alkaliphilus TaxID=427918 RepID=UPI0006986DC0|nr:NAD(P)-dependent alcohol dehydrogenase [Nitriliruptor alkaliphilus]
MKAQINRRYGSPDVMRLEEVADPVIGADEVLIRVRAASVNAGDWFVLTGTPYLLRLAFGLRRPRVQIRGRDVAGVVEEVGADVTEFAPGDAIYAEVERGSFAELTRTRARFVAPKPAGLTFEQAAAVPLAAGAALQGLRDAGGLQPGQRVLIHGASGGVGTFAVQIAKALGGEVTAVCSTGKVDLAHQLGADHVIDYTREDLAASDRRYDLILDVAGCRPLSDLRRVLTSDGTLVLVSGGANRWFGPIGRILHALALSPFVTQRLRPLTAKRDGTDLRSITELIDAGSVTPVIERTYPLSDAAEAMRYVGAGHARAKVVVTV